MRIEAYEKATEESVLRLRLIPYGQGVKLIAVDANGDQVPGTNLLEIQPTLGVRTFCAVAKTVPLPKDGEGRLIVTEGY